MGNDANILPNNELFLLVSDIKTINTLDISNFNRYFQITSNPFLP